MLDTSSAGPGFDVDLTLIASSVADGDPILVLALRGELDLSCCVELDGFLRMTEWATLPVLVDFSQVTFTDSAGLEPFVESARRRRESAAPPLRIGVLGPAAGRVFALLGVNAEPEIDIAAWDALDNCEPLDNCEALDEARSGTDRESG